MHTPNGGTDNDDDDSDTSSHHSAGPTHDPQPPTPQTRPTSTYESHLPTYKDSQKTIKSAMRTSAEAYGRAPTAVQAVVRARTARLMNDMSAVTGVTPLTPSALLVLRKKARGRDDVAWGSEFRGADDGMDELGGTAQVREGLRGVEDGLKASKKRARDCRNTLESGEVAETGTGVAEEEEQWHRQNSFANHLLQLQHLTRVPTRMVGSSTENEVPMQHPCPEGDGIHVATATPSSHNLADRRRAATATAAVVRGNAGQTDDVLDAADDEAPFEPGAEWGAINMVLGAVAGTVNHMMTDPRANNQSPAGSKQAQQDASRTREGLKGLLGRPDSPSPQPFNAAATPSATARHFTASAPRQQSPTPSVTSTTTEASE